MSWMSWDDFDHDFDPFEDVLTSFEAFQKQQGRKVATKPYTVDTHKQKKRNAKNRSKAQKVTDTLFAGEYKNKKNNSNRNKKGQVGGGKNKNKKSNENDKKSNNRKTKEVLMTSVAYEPGDTYVFPF